MPSDSIAGRIAHARQSTRAVLENWSPADLAQGGLCRVLLEAAVTDLRAIESHVRSGDAAVTEGLSSALLELKQEVAQIVRVVDAGLAFHRGVALRMGCSAPSYSPHGQMADEIVTIGRRGMEV